MTLTWNGTTGSFLLSDYFSPNATFLQGTVYSFAATLFNPGATFAAKVLLSTTSFGLGNDVFISMGSTDFSSTAIDLGSGQADITAVPEPGTLVLMGLGSAVVALRRRRRRS
jgi:hypothetical protein